MKNLIIAIFLIVSIPALTGKDKKTILALGDSITQGGKSFTCYRQILVPQLKAKGLNVEFIGPNKDATSAHAGYGGKNTGFLLSNIDKIYSKYPADIVLIHAGHNNFAKDKPIPKVIKNTEAIIL